MSEVPGSLPVAGGLSLFAVWGVGGLRAAAAPADPLAEGSPVLAGLVGASVQRRVALGARAGARIRRVGDEPDLGHVASRGPRQAVQDPSVVRAILAHLGAAAPDRPGPAAPEPGPAAATG